ncbi:hypothetical protein GCM10028781_34210 [Nostocoides australiense]
MVTAIVLTLIVTLGLVAGLVILLLPLVTTVRARLRVDLERRLAEVQLQRVTSEAMLRLLREGRKP